MMSFSKSLKEIFVSKGVLWNMTLRELKAKYVGSMLGIWWSVITPLLIMGAVSFIFTKVMKIDIVRFPLFSLAGIIPWFFFSVSLSEATLSLTNRSNLLKQFSFPCEFIPISSVLANFLNFIVGFIFILPIFILFNNKILPELIYLPIVIILHLLFVIGLGLFLSSLNVFVRDVSHLLGVVLLFWFWVTPIFYSVEMVPESYHCICNLNPMAIYIGAYRAILYKAESPELFLIIKASIVSLVVLVSGYLSFLKTKPYFMKRI